MWDTCSKETRATTKGKEVWDTCSRATPTTTKALPEILRQTEAIGATPHSSQSWSWKKAACNKGRLISQIQKEVVL